MLRRCEAGVALIEFALVLPVLIVILLGTVEIARFAIIHQKIDKVANSMADFVTQGGSVSTSNLATFSQAVPEIMRPFTFDGTVIFSSVGFFATPIPPCSGAGVPCIAWQQAELGSDPSRIGSPGGNATLPGGYTVLENQNVIVAEVFLNYTPMLTVTGELIPALAPQLLYKVAVYKPRQGTLLTLESN